MLCVIGEILDSIQYQVNQTQDFVVEGNTNLTQAVMYQKLLRYKQCCCIVTAILVIGAIAVVIYFVLLKKK